MSERQSSGLVKKGKFVKALLEVMSDGILRDSLAIWRDGKGNIGPSQDYVQTNLDKLVASGEVILENSTYRLPEGTKPIVTERAQESPKPANVPAQVQKVITVVHGQLDRNPKVEEFLCFAFMNEVPGWQTAIEYYCAIHGVTYSIETLKGKIGGERIIFA